MPVPALASQILVNYHRSAHSEGKKIGVVNIIVILLAIVRTRFRRF
jgi:hypothetical protein